MKKSGLTTVIIVSLAAMAFLPKNVAQWVVLAAIVVFAAVKGISYYAEHKDEISAKKEKIRKRAEISRRTAQKSKKIVVAKLIVIVYNYDVLRKFFA